jgi:hypothetical protein
VNNNKFQWYILLLSCCLSLSAVVAIILYNTNSMYKPKILSSNEKGIVTNNIEGTGNLNKVKLIAKDAVFLQNESASIIHQLRWHLNIVFVIIFIFCSLNVLLIFKQRNSNR